MAAISQLDLLELPALLKEKKENKSRMDGRTTTPPYILTHSITYVSVGYLCLYTRFLVYVLLIEDYQTNKENIF